MSRILRPRRPRIEIPLAERRSVLVPMRLRALSSVVWETAICDAAGRVERVLQRGRNTITDFGMDQLAGKTLPACITHLHLSDTLATRKRVAGGEELTVTYTDAATITLTTDTNFFEAGDVGRTFKISGATPWPEMLIDGFTSATEVTATARDGVWLPGFTPPASPAGPYTTFGVHYTDGSTVANQFTKYGTFDTASADFNAELNDSANSRFNNQRIWLGPVVTGSAWTVNQVGWSDNNGGNNCFGIANLGSPDVIPVDKRYRLKLNAYQAYEPLNLVGVVADWGATVGSHTIDIRQERIAFDSNGIARTFLSPGATVDGNQQSAWVTSTMTLQTTQWAGDPGFTSISRTHVRSNIQTLSNGAYTNGTHNRTRRIWWPDTVSFTNATGLLALDASVTGWPGLAIRPQSGTITKPSGFMIDLTFPIHWTRELLN